jgi:hypothetical protein
MKLTGEGGALTPLPFGSDDGADGKNSPHSSQYCDPAKFTVPQLAHVVIAFKPLAARIS